MCVCVCVAYSQERNIEIRMSPYKHKLRHRTSVVLLAHKPIKKRICTIINAPTDPDNMIGRWSIKLDDEISGYAKVHKNHNVDVKLDDHAPLLFKITDKGRLVNNQMLREKLYWSPEWLSVRTIRWNLNQPSFKYTSKVLLWEWVA